MTVKTADDAVDLGPFRHYMQKEIFEQPRAVADTLENVGSIEASLFGANAADVFANVDAVHLLACGTSYYAAWWRDCGSKASPASRRRRRSRANTAIATAFPTRRR